MDERDKGGGDGGSGVLGFLLGLLAGGACVLLVTSRRPAEAATTAPRVEPKAEAAQSADGRDIEPREPQEVREARERREGIEMRILESLNMTHETWGALSMTEGRTKLREYLEARPGESTDEARAAVDDDAHIYRVGELLSAVAFGLDRERLIRR